MKKLIPWIYTLAILGIILFFYCSGTTNRLPIAPLGTGIKQIQSVSYRVDGGAETTATLPTTINQLPSSTAVVVSAQVTADSNDSLQLKTAFSPLRVFVNDQLVYENGAADSFSRFLNDPPTMLAIIPLEEGTHDLRLEYFSPTQRSHLVVQRLFIGNESELITRMILQEGFSFLFSIVLIFMGIMMIVVSIWVLRSIRSSSAFLWLGLFSLAAGTWVLGECDLSLLLIPYPSLLYFMAYLGLFTLSIPFIKYGLQFLKPKTELPLKIMLWVNYIALLAVVLLQLTSVVDFTKTLYLFHIITPLSFVLFAVVLLFECFGQKNKSAKQFLIAILLLASSTVLEVTNYWLPFTDLLTVFFQLGVLLFICFLGVASGRQIQQSMKTEDRNLRLSLDNIAMKRQIDIQKLHYMDMVSDIEDTRRQHHDLRHQLAVIRQLNHGGEKQQISSYLDELTANIPLEKQVQYCENLVVNAVVYHYLSLAELAGIDATVNLDIRKENGSIQDSDLCVILGNLFENALEACEKLSTGAKSFIQMKSKIHNDLLIITLDNSFDGSAFNEDDHFASSKGDRKGVGLDSVRAIARKYSGNARFETRDKVFLSSVYLNMSDEGEED